MHSFMLLYVVHFTSLMFLTFIGPRGLSFEIFRYSPGGPLSLRDNGGFGFVFMSEKIFFIARSGRS
jgi:hypothetical protein